MQHRNTYLTKRVQGHVEVQRACAGFLDQVVGNVLWLDFRVETGPRVVPHARVNFTSLWSNLFCRYKQVWVRKNHTSPVDVKIPIWICAKAIWSRIRATSFAPQAILEKKSKPSTTILTFFYLLANKISAWLMKFWNRFNKSRSEKNQVNCRIDQMIKKKVL
jgi:hypothetical protein